jgi:hypothetical protein
LSGLGDLLGTCFDTFPKEKRARLTWPFGAYSEATAGFEPANKGFADLCLTTWLRRHEPTWE